MLQVLDSVLAENGIVMVLSGDTAVKAVAVAAVSGASSPESTRPWEQLPDSRSYMVRTVRPNKVMPMLGPFSKLPNGILCSDGGNLLVLRDYAANIRQELKLLEKVDKPTTPSFYGLVSLPTLATQLSLKSPWLVGSGNPPVRLR